MQNKDFSFTKKQLGIFCVIIGILGIVAIFAIDIIDMGREGGIGPVQTIGLLVMGAVTLLGITLIPLGDDLA